MSCKIRGLLVTIPDPLGRKSLQEENDKCKRRCTDRGTRTTSRTRDSEEQQLEFLHLRADPEHQNKTRTPNVKMTIRYVGNDLRSAVPNLESARARLGAFSRRARTCRRNSPTPNSFQPIVRPQQRSVADPKSCGPRAE